MDRNMDPCGDL